MPLLRNRRPNIFAILLWVVALALLVAGFIVRHLGISAYASAYANSSTVTDELTYYTSIITAQYTADLGNYLMAAGALAVVVALLYQALSTVLHRNVAAIVDAQVGDVAGVGSAIDEIDELEESTAQVLEEQVPADQLAVSEPEAVEQVPGAGDTTTVPVAETAEVGSVALSVDEPANVEAAPASVDGPVEVDAEMVGTPKSLGDEDGAVLVSEEENELDGTPEDGAAPDDVTPAAGTSDSDSEPETVCPARTQ